MAKLVTVGEILVEVMAAEIGQTFLKPGTFLAPYPSGAPAIMIDQAARMGASCAIIACVGMDDFGALNINRLKTDGVDVRGIVQKDDETTGVAFVGYAADGSRRFIFHFAHAAAGSLEPQEINVDVFEGIEFFHVMGCSLSAGRKLQQSVLEGIRIAKQNGAKVSFDPNIRPELLKEADTLNVLNAILESSDVLLSGKSEIEMLTGLTVDQAIEHYRDQKVLVIKDGKRGAHIISGETDIVIPAYKVEETDPTGAGDCFDGAFLAAIISGKSFADAAAIGNAAGALSVTKQGPMEGAAYMADIQKLIQTQK